MGTTAAAVPPPSRGRLVFLALALFLGVVAALGVYVQARGTGFHLPASSSSSSSSAVASSSSSSLHPSTTTTTTATLHSRLRRHLAWGGEEEDIPFQGDDGDDNGGEDGEDGGLEAPGVPDDGTGGKKKKKKFSFDDELEGDEEPADEEEEDGGDGGDGDEEEEKPKKKKKAPKKKTKPKGMPKMDEEEEDAAAGEEGEEEADVRVKPKKTKKAKKPVSDDEEGDDEGGDDEDGEGTVVIKARPGGGTSSISKGKKKNPEDGKKDPLAPTLDTRDSRRYADEVLLPDGHTINIDVPSP